MTREDLQAWLGDKNVQAFLHVIGAGETSDALTEQDYRTINGGATIAGEWVHPYIGIPTTQGGRAAGAFQFLGTTWADLAKRYGFTGFTPEEQMEGAVALIAEHGAIAAVQAGDLVTAIQKLGTTWVSLPGLGTRAASVFHKYGGAVSAPQPAPEPTPQPSSQGGQPMGALALLPLIAQFIPQIVSLLKPDSKSGAKDAATAQLVLNTVGQAVGVLQQGEQATAASTAAAADKMAADPEMAKKAQQAVVTHPAIMPLLEVGGGVAAAREADLKAQASDKPFWKASPVFWISVLMLPIVYWLVGSLIVGGVPLPDDAPWWVKTMIAMFGTAWNGESRSGGFNLVIGLILGGICGVYYGVSVTQQKQQPTAGVETKD